MLPAILLLAVAARADAEIDARVSEDLATISMTVRYRFTPDADRDAVTIVLPADRYRSQPELGPADEREQYPRGFEAGGFTSVRIAIDGAPCAPVETALEDGARMISCAGRFARGSTIGIE